MALSAPSKTRLAVVARNLDNPRKIFVSRAGVVYVAEAGVGGNDECVATHPHRTCVDHTGSITEVTATGQRKAKGGRQRTVPIHPVLEPLFVDYLQIRGGDPEPALFVGVQGKRLSQTILTQTFLRYAQASGVSERKRVTPHKVGQKFHAVDPGVVERSREQRHGDANTTGSLSR